MSLKRYQFLIIILVFSFQAIAQTQEECQKMVLEGVEEMNKKNHAKSIELLTQAQSIANANGWYKQEFLAVNNIGANYYILLDYGEALNNYLEAYKIALKELEPKYEMVVLNNIAILYSKEKKYDKAGEYFLKAFELATENKDSLKIGMYAINLAAVSNEINDLESADQYLEISVSLMKKFPSIEKLVKAAQVNNLVLKKNYSEAKSIAESVLLDLKSPEFTSQRISTYMLLSKIFEKEGNLEKAIEVVKLAQNDAHASLENKLDAYRRLSDLYRSKNEINFAFGYRDSVELIKDSLNQIKNGQLFENSQIKFELQKSQNELSKSQENLQRERKTYYRIIGATILFVILLLWALRNYLVKMKQRKIIAERTQKITELELEKEKHNKILLEQKLKESQTLSLLEQEKLKNEIEAKNRELTSKALSIATRNELMEEVITLLSKESKLYHDANLSKRIFELKNHLKKNSEWDDFLFHFEKTNYGFLTNLKERHPDLNANDIRFLSYVYMNLSTKEISSLLNITVEACRKRKERIVKKMNLPEETDIYSYLSNT